ncbi:hypothetical protein M8818_006053 [Zalaria obscura]|uniref:Uncharacterized protein n=1 Tax=Zalaria obscura TaxID=2024903 RepID=A0ACC3S6T1_9PEZI
MGLHSILKKLTGRKKKESGVVYTHPNVDINHPIADASFAHHTWETAGQYGCKGSCCEKKKWKRQYKKVMERCQNKRLSQ